MTMTRNKLTLSERQICALECQAELDKYRPAEDDFDCAEDMKGVYLVRYADDLEERLRVFESKPFDGFPTPQVIHCRDAEAVDAVIARHAASMREISAFRKGGVRVENLPEVYPAFACTVIMPSENPRQSPRFNGISEIFATEADCLAFCEADKAECGRDKFHPLAIDDDEWMQIFPRPHRWIVDPVTLQRLA